MPETIHIVTAGSTLGGIAKKFGVPLGVLIDVNGITDPNRIKVGQKLIIPSTSTDSMEGESETSPAVVTPVPDGLAINQKKFRLASSLFNAVEQEKDLIVLHYTAGGSARSAFDTWVQRANKVATAYIADLDGTIYELFDPRFWAFHLGLSGAAAAGFKHDRRSIGIEIVNQGILRPDASKPDQLNWWPNDFRTKFCLKSEQSRYVAASYRGFDFHAAFPGVQIESTCQLVRHLCDRFSIPKRLPPVAMRPEFDIQLAGGFKGVISHQNFRKDKFDVGPAFDWDRIFS